MYHVCPEHGIERCFASANPNYQERHFCSGKGGGEKVTWIGQTLRDDEVVPTLSTGMASRKQRLAWGLQKDRICRNCSAIFREGSSVGKFLRHVQTCGQPGKASPTEYIHPSSREQPAILSTGGLGEPPTPTGLE